MFKTKRAEKKAKRELEKIKAKENPVIAILNGDGMLDHMILRKKTIIHTQSGEGEGLLFYGNVIIPFVDRFPKDLKLYSYMTTKPEEIQKDE